MQKSKIMNNQEVCCVTNRSSGWSIQCRAHSWTDVCLGDDGGSHRVLWGAGSPGPCGKAECRALSSRGLGASESSALDSVTTLLTWRAGRVWVLSKTKKSVLLRAPGPWRWPRAADGRSRERRPHGSPSPHACAEVHPANCQHYECFFSYVLAVWLEKRTLHFSSAITHPWT